MGTSNPRLPHRSSPDHQLPEREWILEKSRNEDPLKEREKEKSYPTNARLQPSTRQNTRTYTSPLPRPYFPAMTDDMNMADYIASRDDYILYESERGSNLLDKNMKRKMCARDIEWQGDISHHRSNKFIRRNGDCVEKFQCQEKIAQLATEEDTCYSDIPLEKGGFVKPQTRLYTSHSAPRPCNQHYGLKVHTEEDSWVEMNPLLQENISPT